VKKGKPKNYIPEEMIKAIATAYLKGEPIDGEIAVIDRKQAEEADYNLSPSRWVGQVDDAEIGSISSLLAKLHTLHNEDVKTTGALLDLLKPLAKEDVA
jgi:type I restriction enzyme M protein